MLATVALMPVYPPTLAFVDELMDTDVANGTTTLTVTEAAVAELPARSAALSVAVH